MTLEIDIQIKRQGFALEAAFACSGGPLGILGASGAGKSMTLRAIAGLETPDSGRIVLDGRVLFDSASGINLPSRSRRVGLLFQDYALFPHLTVEQNVAFGLRQVASDTRRERTAEQLKAMRLQGLEQRSPVTLSGGEQQRVALARALAPQPAALLLDEPFSALDSHLRGQVERQLHETLAEYHGTRLLVSHNLEELYRLCADLLVLDKGRVIARGSRDDIFRQPANRRTAELTGCKNFSRARLVDSDSVEALDWGCRLDVGHNPSVTTKHVAIRAHHIDVAPRPEASAQEIGNAAYGWLADSTEGPFRVTLYLHLQSRLQPPGEPLAHHVQAEVTREQWHHLQAAGPPWIVRFNPEQLILLPD